MKATLVKSLSWDKHHYRLDPPLVGHTNVVASYSNSPLVEAETLIFAADESGEIIDWLEIGGARCNGHDAVAALLEEGYEVVE
jgi:Iap family predicted aminopeptidase